MVMGAPVAASADGVTTYPIAPGYSVNVRSGPGTSYRIVRVLPEGSRVSISCQRPGDSVSGPYGTSSIWDNIANGEYISDAYVKTGSDGYVAPRCA
ncbi:SH3 domain-containing protein [Streptomyces mirabilis]